MNNRDEFYSKPTERAQFWKDNELLLAGRDLISGGTWFGITKKGKFAIITNCYSTFNKDKALYSRGKIVTDYLKKNIISLDFLKQLKDNSLKYYGFNLILGDTKNIYYFSNYNNTIIELNYGQYGLGNYLLNDNSKKIIYAKEAFYKVLSSDFSIENLFDILNDKTILSDKDIKNSDAGILWDRIFSARFIISSSYGTRSSTILLIDKNDNINFFERTYSNNASIIDEVSYSFKG